MPKKKAKATGKKSAGSRSSSKLVLNQWLLSLFNVQRFEDLAENLRDEAMEGTGREQRPPLPPRAHGTAFTPT